MYIENTTKDVKDLIEVINKESDISKLKILIYIFNLINNDQINNKNIVNPNMIENLVIFNLQSIGLNKNIGIIFLQYLAMTYVKVTNKNNIYEDNGIIIGVNYCESESKILSLFENLEFNEKLDFISELIIKCENETYFKDKIIMLSLNSNLSGFDIANLIQKYIKK